MSSERMGRLRYYVADAIDEWRHSPGVNLLALATLTAVLFVAGLVLLVMSNLRGHLDTWREDVRVDVYLTDNITNEERATIEARLSAMREVTRVVAVSKEEALERFRATFGEALAALPDELGTNPLPASFEAYLAGSDDAARSARAVAEAVGGLTGVEEVRFDREWLDRLDALLTVAGAGGGALAVLVLGAVVLVMASVLRLAVYTRRDEIEIMQLVGATSGFVRGPFLVAGLVHGLLASGFAIGLLEIVRKIGMSQAGASTGALAGLVVGRPLSATLSALLVVLGVGVGLAGSWAAVRRGVN
ncbi:MAG: ABC transporter permease [Acidobacteriota bacterium]|nr:ABC transporter permease [Acidobacteriota bacterium]